MKITMKLTNLASQKQVIKEELAFPGNFYDKLASPDARKRGPRDRKQN